MKSHAAIIALHLLLADGFAPAIGLAGRSYHGPPRTDIPANGGGLFYDEQSLDHFADTAERLGTTWSQRYFEDSTFWGGPGFPFLLSMGGEGAVNGPPGGLQRQLAEEHQANLISLEHRFYGESRPDSNMSTANLIHLTSAQALADAAQFIGWMSETKASTESLWITFGGSYSANLAAWMRSKYPSDVAGAIAFSGPVLAQLDFYQYNQQVTTSIRRLGGEDCVDLVSRGSDALSSMLEANATSRAAAASMFKACETPKTEDDIRSLMGSVMGTIQSLVQYNRVGSSKDIASFCATGRSAAASGADAAETFAAMVMQTMNLDCHTATYAAALEPLLDESFDGTSMMRQWTYQLCNEFGSQTCEPGALECAQGVAAEPDLFYGLSRPDDLAFGLQLCQDVFGITNATVPSAKWNEHQRGWTNVANGGKSYGGSHVVFVNGLVDPYSTLSILPEELAATQASLDVQCLTMENQSHCAGMWSASASDPPEMAVVHEQVSEAVARWLGDGRVAGAFV